MQNFTVVTTATHATIQSTIGLGSLVVPIGVYQALLTCNNTPLALWVQQTIAATGYTNAYLRMGVVVKLQQHGQTKSGKKLVGLSVLQTTKGPGGVYLTWGVAGELHTPCTRHKQNGGIAPGLAMQLQGAGAQGQNVELQAVLALAKAS